MSSLGKAGCMKNRQRVNISKHLQNYCHCSKALNHLKILKWRLDSVEHDLVNPYLGPWNRLNLDLAQSDWTTWTSKNVKKYHLPRSKHALCPGTGKSVSPACTLEQISSCTFSSPCPNANDAHDRRSLSTLIMLITCIRYWYCLLAILTILTETWNRWKSGFSCRMFLVILAQAFFKPLWQPLPHQLPAIQTSRWNFDTSQLAAQIFWGRFHLTSVIFPAHPAKGHWCPAGGVHFEVPQQQTKSVFANGDPAAWHAKWALTLSQHIQSLIQRSTLSCNLENETGGLKCLNT